jgi:hypothetical protein
VLGKLAASCPDSVTCSHERGNRQAHTCRSPLSIGGGGGNRVDVSGVN